MSGASSMRLRNVTTNKKHVFRLIFEIESEACYVEFFTELNSLPMLEIYVYMSLKFVFKRLYMLGGVGLYQVYP